MENLNLLTDSNRLLREERESLGRKVSELEGKSRRLSDDLQQLRETNRTLLGQKDTLVAEKTALRFVNLSHTHFHTHTHTTHTHTQHTHTHTHSHTHTHTHTHTHSHTHTHTHTHNTHTHTLGTRYRGGTRAQTNSSNSTMRWTLKITRNYCKYPNISKRLLIVSKHIQEIYFAQKITVSIRAYPRDY